MPARCSPLISTELWTQLNVFHNRMLARADAGRYRAAAAEPPMRRASRRACQAHTGHRRRHHLPRPGLVLLFRVRPATWSGRTRPPGCSTPSTHHAAAVATQDDRIAARSSGNGTRCCAPPPATTPIRRVYPRGLQRGGCRRFPAGRLRPSRARCIVSLRQVNGIADRAEIALHGCAVETPPSETCRRDAGGVIGTLHGHRSGRAPPSCTISSTGCSRTSANGGIGRPRTVDFFDHIGT